jgi:hypothetical protein
MRQPRPALPGEINYDWFDRFTLAHLAIGCVYGWLGLQWWWMAALAIGWEWLENPMKAYLPWMFPHASKDTLRNSIGDCLAVASGWWATRALLAGG